MFLRLCLLSSFKVQEYIHSVMDPQISLKYGESSAV